MISNLDYTFYFILLNILYIKPTSTNLMQRVAQSLMRQKLKVLNFRLAHETDSTCPGK